MIGLFRDLAQGFRAVCSGGISAEPIPAVPNGLVEARGIFCQIVPVRRVPVIRRFSVRKPVGGYTEGLVRQVIVLTEIKSLGVFLAVSRVLADRSHAVAVHPPGKMYRLEARPKAGNGPPLASGYHEAGVGTFLRAQRNNLELVFVRSYAILGAKCRPEALLACVRVQIRLMKGSWLPPVLPVYGSHCR